MKQIAAAIALFLAPLASAEADSHSATMGVSVRVVARARVTVASQPAEVVVTSSDVARGYVHIDSPITLSAHTNSRSGYLLQVNTTSSQFAGAQLTAEDVVMNVIDEAWVRRPYVAGGETVAIRARLLLTPGTTPGRYALPLVFRAQAL